VNVNPVVDECGQAGPLILPENREARTTVMAISWGLCTNPEMACEVTFAAIGGGIRWMRDPVSDNSDHPRCQWAWSVLKLVKAHLRKRSIPPPISRR